MGDQALKNMSEVLTASGSSLDRVVKTTVMLKDMSYYAAVNEVYGKYFHSHKPARSAFAVAGLPKTLWLKLNALRCTTEQRFGRYLPWSAAVFRSPSSSVLPQRSGTSNVTSIPA